MITYNLGRPLTYLPQKIPSKHIKVFGIEIKRKGEIMLKIIKWCFTLIILAIVLLIPVAVFATTQGTLSDGWRIYDSAGGIGYRYGPSIIINPDNSIDMWASSPGSGDQWDQIRYRHSNDGGHTWTSDQVVLTPTPGSDDQCSTCDPGVIKIGQYYYIGYTSIKSASDVNHVFVARSTSPTGPFEKWNGNGWGGNPKPFITYDGPAGYFGCGEPSFVVKDNTIYVYYTWVGADVIGGTHVIQTRLKTGSASDSNWPGNLVYQGVAFNKQVYADDDSTDVKYCDQLGKFIAVNSSYRMSPYGHIDMWESTDGLNFTQAILPEHNIGYWCHNVGISGTSDGHLDLSKNNFISYAYGQVVASWSTWLNPISFSTTNLPATPELTAAYAGNGSVTLEYRGVNATSYKIRYGTTSGTYTNTISDITGNSYTVSGLTNGQQYFFVVASTNSYGDSANSWQMSAKPLPYSAAPRVAVTASSNISGWEASKAIDSDVNTNWSSIGHTNSDAVEWISVDTGANREIARVILTPRLPGFLCYPGSFKIQVSPDGASWTDASLNPTWSQDDYKTFASRIPNVKRIYEFNRPLWGRYVRIYATKLSSDFNNFYMQLADISIDQLPVTATASTTITGWVPTNVLDGLSGCWSSASHSTASATEWLSLDLGISQTVKGVFLKARDSGTAFPVDFKFQYSNDGNTWYDIAGQSYVNYPNPGNGIKSFRFSAPVTARYVRMYATKLSFEGSAYYCQINEFYADVDKSLPIVNAVASSSLSGWSVSSLFDKQDDGGVPCWSSISHSNEYSTEWVYVDLGSAQNISEVRISGRHDHYDSGTGFPVDSAGYNATVCFPLDFTIQYSNDAVNWSIVPGEDHTQGYFWPWPVSATQQIFKFENIISARYIRVNATRLRPDNYGNYYFQLGEIHVNP